jgi:myo-inositol 2-dehydrogenase/D-chiro-inositol 1-dehydrogenase
MGACTVRETTLDAAPPLPEYLRGSGGFFRDCAVHGFDAIRWVTGHEVLEVYAVGVNRGAGSSGPQETWTRCRRLTMDDGAPRARVEQPVQRGRLRRAAGGLLTRPTASAPGLTAVCRCVQSSRNWIFPASPAYPGFWTGSGTLIRRSSRHS